MSKIAVVYWSGTGNTEMMAEAVLEGAKSAGAEASSFTPETFSPAKMDEFDAVAFGCPSMGDEELEETEFQPLFAECEPKLKGRRIAYVIFDHQTTYVVTPKKHDELSK